jgi:membrane peptidoglycan carboxypeptidase
VLDIQLASPFAVPLTPRALGGALRIADERLEWLSQHFKPKKTTPATILSDTPSTFYSGDQAYQPGNFNREFRGDVTMRDALAHSLNVATVSPADRVGYKRVVATARLAGLNDAIVIELHAVR